jgi:MYXO-CTERM domain-containing protein
MITNALTRFTSGPPPVAVDAGPPPDATVSTVEAAVSTDDASVSTDDAAVAIDDASLAVDDASVVGAENAEGDVSSSGLPAIENPGVASGCGCGVAGRSARPLAALAMLGLGAWLRRRRG